VNTRFRLRQTPDFRGALHKCNYDTCTLFKLRLDNHTVEALVKDFVNSTNDTSFPLATVDLGDMIDYRVKMVDGLLSFAVNGASQSVNVFQKVPAWTNQTFYFKAGNYCQDNFGLPDEGAVVSFYHLNVNHSHD